MSYLNRALRKKSGHEFIGICVAEFVTTRGEQRIVVESTVSGALGLLFIFRPDQMEEQPGYSIPSHDSGPLVRL